MKILIVGGGGREHAMAWKAAQSPLAEKIYCAPGNGGIADVAECVPIGSEDIDGLLQFALNKKIDLTLVGPEAPLTMGIADRFSEAGLKVFGPKEIGARLEGSKKFAKEFMAKHGIPTAAYKDFEGIEAALEYIDQAEFPVVVKADGLAAGKGVHVARGKDDAKAFARKAMDELAFGEAGTHLVIEERLEGEELSVLALCDGESAWPLVASQDHKRAYDGDQGPNTGGMGAYAPLSIVDDALMSRVQAEVLDPVIKGMKELGCPFVGVLYAGLMLTADGPKALEFNVRFGDPEAQAVLPLLKSDLVALCDAACSGKGLSATPPESNGQSAVCVVMASGGYPGSYEKGKPILGLLDAGAADGVTIFHAGTKLADGQIVTSGGRVLGVTAVGPDFESAIRAAYESVEKITWDGAMYRRDIGRREAARAAARGN